MTIYLHRLPRCPCLKDSTSNTQVGLTVDVANYSGHNNKCFHVDINYPKGSTNCSAHISGTRKVLLKTTERRNSQLGECNSRGVTEKQHLVTTQLSSSTRQCPYVCAYNSFSINEILTLNLLLLLNILFA